MKKSDIQTIETEDVKGNKYKKWRFFSDGNAIVCMNGSNKHYRGQPNVSLRKGLSSFGTEVVFQLEIRELINEYTSSSGFPKHLEFYLTEDQAKELVEKLAKHYKLGSIFDPNEWSKDMCERCGNGHLYCKDCKKYTWSKHETENKETNKQD